ncbi:MAG: hypothetical protein ACE5GG_05395 [Candidatus Omnitrophota bacterium]
MNRLFVRAVVLSILIVAVCGLVVFSYAGGNPPQRFILGSEEHLFYGGYADASVIRLDDGTYLMYLSRNRETGERHGVFVLSSTDGIRWERETATVLPDVAVGRAVRFPGGVRYYYHQPPGRRVNRGSIVSSFSRNGISNWQYEGGRIEPRPGYAAVGPTIIRLRDGTYRMFFHEAKLGEDGKMPRVPEAEIVGASSRDGLSWQRDTSPSIVSEKAVEGGRVLNARHPFVMPWKDGYLMFYWAHRLIYAAYSRDGYTWQKLGSTGIHGADPHLIPLGAGRYRIYYGGRCRHKPRCFAYPGPGVINTVILKIE